MQEANSSSLTQGDKTRLVPPSRHPLSQLRLASLQSRLGTRAELATWVDSRQANRAQKFAVSWG